MTEGVKNGRYLLVLNILGCKNKAKYIIRTIFILLSRKRLQCKSQKSAGIRGQPELITKKNNHDYRIRDV